MTRNPDLDKMRRASYLEWTLWHQLDQGPPLMMPEWQYQIDGKGHRWDFGWEEQRLLVDVQGGAWNNGAHVRGAGYQRDRMLSNRAQIDGWMVLEFTGGQVEDGTALGVIRDALEARMYNDREMDL